MPESLPIPSFEVEGFRAIRSLKVADLKRVNLFVGENNAGKTSLLEALQLYLHRNSRTLSAVLLDTVRGHSDFSAPVYGSTLREDDALELQFAIDAVEGLFYGSFHELPLHPIRLSPAGDDATSLTIRLPWSPDGPIGDGASSERPAVVDPASAVLDVRSEARGFEIPLNWFARRVVLRSAELHLAVVIPSNGLSSFDTRTMWDNIAVSGREALVEDALRVIVPQLDRIILIGESRLRSVVCKLKGVARPIPLKAMGDAATRVFGMAVAVAHAQGGAVLIDEVENGLHYSIQSQVWNAIFSMASTLDVQVFATTHSWDTVVAFQDAANRSPEEGILYRLDREDDGWIHPVRYTEEEVAIAADQQIEVR
jgi:hypothetical protein